MIARQSLRSFRISPGKILVSSLYVALFLTLSIALSRLVKGLDSLLLLQICLFGYLTGWLAARIRLNAFTGMLAAGIVGIVGLIIRLANLAGQLLLLAWSISQRIPASNTLLPDASSYPDVLPGILKEISQALEVIFYRSQSWVENLQSPFPIYDPLPITLLWGFVLWLVVAWAGWAFYQRKPVQQVLLPALVFLTGSSGLVRFNPIYIFVFFALAFILNALYEQMLRERNWDTGSVDYSLEIRTDLLMVVVPLSIVLLGAAGLLPSISFDWVKDVFNPKVNAPGIDQPPIAQSFGLEPPPMEAALSARLRSPGLPTEKLIGAGPELSQRVVMEISVDDNQPGSFPYYWQGLTYDWYTGHGWATHPTGRNDLKAGANLYLYDPGLFRPLLQQVNGIEDLGNVLYHTGKLITANKTYHTERRSTEDLFVATVKGGQYQVTSAIPTFSREVLRQASRNYPKDIYNTELQLPDSLPARVYSLARDITARADNPYDQALAIQTYLRQFPYTLKLDSPPVDRDVVDYFLFDLKKGYCDYYASSMVVLARASGIPARLVSGYATGRYDQQKGVYVVSEADAHSWPELYFPGYGWIVFEPTASEPLPRTISFAEMQPPQRPTASGAVNSPGQSLPKPPNVLQVLLLAGGLLFFLQLLRVYIRWSERRQPPILRMNKIYASLRRETRRLRAPIKSGDTPFETADLFNNHIQNLKPVWNRLKPKTNPQDVFRLVALYSRSVYSPRPVSEFDALEAFKLWKNIQRDLNWLHFLLLIRPASKDQQ